MPDDLETKAEVLCGYLHVWEDMHVGWIPGSRCQTTLLPPLHIIFSMAPRPVSILAMLRMTWNIVLQLSLFLSFLMDNSILFLMLSECLMLLPH